MCCVCCAAAFAPLAGCCGSSPSGRSRPHPAALGASAAAQHTQHIEPTHLNPGSSSTGLLICTIQFQFIMCIYSELCYPVVLLQLSGQDGSCDDSVTSSNFNRRNLPILTSVFARASESQTDFVKTDFLDDGGQNSDFLHSQPAARALSSSSRPGQSGDARRDGLCELCSPREGDVGCDPVNTLEHSGLF